MAEVTLTAGARNTLLTLQQTQDLVGRTQNRLATGLRVASPLDDGRAFFEAEALTSRASDVAEKKDGIDQAISAVSVTLETVEAVDALLSQLKGLAIGARSGSSSALAQIVAQFNEVRDQIDRLADDASYQGINLVNSTGSTLSVSFSPDTASALTISGVNLKASSGLSIDAAAGFSVAGNIASAIGQIDNALALVRGHAQALGSRVALLQTRLDFSSSYANELDTGAGKLTLADINEEGANLVALQTRQQLAINAMPTASGAEDGILQLFR